MNTEATLGNALVRLIAPLRRLGLFQDSFSRFVYEAAYRKYKLSYEAREVVRATRLIPEGSTVVDVGANIGVLTEVFAKRVGAGGRVIAIEPERSTARRLIERLKRCGLFDRVEVFEGVATNYVGQATLAFSLDHPGDHHIADTGEIVAGTTIDALLETRGWPSVSLVKIDVQGAEERVIEGMERFLALQNPLLCVEVDAQALRRSKVS
jgi:FkbM family methyltransferase